jgi:hypothetical protein
MSDIFTLNKDYADEDVDRKINLDDLFEKKRTKNIDELRLFNKILGRIHNKIQLTSRQRVEEQFIWYIIPEFILGYSKYKQADCIIYVIDKLQENKFKVNYYHPSLLYIFWGHWFPRYIRDKVKTKLGFTIDEYGRKVEEEDGEVVAPQHPYPSAGSGGASSSVAAAASSSKKYADIRSYNPTGNLTYNKIIAEGGGL